MVNQTSEALFEDALEGAVEEAVGEVDSIEGDDDFGLEDVTEDEAVSEQESEDVDNDEVVETENEAVENDLEPELEQVAKTFEQTGNPDDLPPELVGSYKLMQAGMTKKAQELAEARRRYEDATQRMTQTMEDQQKAAKAIPRPARPSNPTDGMSVEDQNKRWQEISEYDAETAYKKMVENGAVPDPDRVNRQLAEQEAAADGQRRFNMIASKEGYTDQVGQAMEDLAKSNPYWANQIVTDDGATACFDYVKTQMIAAELKKTAAELENANVKRSAGAGKRATPKPTTQNKSVTTKPTDNFKDMAFDDQIGSIIDDSFGV